MSSSAGITQHNVPFEIIVPSYLIFFPKQVPTQRLQPENSVTEGNIYNKLEENLPPFI